MKSAMWRGWLIWVGLLGLALPAASMELSGGLGAGSVNMEYLNGQLEALASRRGEDYSPIRLAWEVHGAFWPSYNVGIGIRMLSASGAIHGRLSENLVARALGIEGCGRFHLPLFGKRTWAQLGLGIFGGTLSGLMTGNGIALGGYVGGAFPIFSGRRMDVTADVVYRYLPFHSLRGENGAISPSGVLVIDFSGLYICLNLLWGR